MSCDLPHETSLGKIERSAEIRELDFIRVCKKARLRGRRYVKVGIDNLANFLSISPNQTKYLPSVCLVPGLDFSAIPVSISAVFRKAINLYTF